MTPLIRAAADVVEESILNALCAAETISGRSGRMAHEMPLDLISGILASTD
jgi:D-aminopeptidase